MRMIDTLIIHCTATRPEWMEKNSINDQVKEVEKWHTTPPRNWQSIGYHFVVGRNGEVAQGRPVEKSGAHAKGYNKSSIGVALVGGFGSDADDLAQDHFTPVQLAALYELIKNLQANYNIPNANVIGHNGQINGKRISNKACPGFRVQKWLAGMSLSEATVKKPERTKPTQSKTVKASAATAVASVGTAATAMSGMDQFAQYIILGFVGVSILLCIYIMRERLKAWTEGWH